MGALTNAFLTYQMHNANQDSMKTLYISLLVQIKAQIYRNTLSNNSCNN
jgi:hypothetical protein